jgi:hypothetical protein
MTEDPMTEHEEFEAAGELDRALRAGVMVMAQLMERWARGREYSARTAVWESGHAEPRSAEDSFDTGMGETPGGGDERPWAAYTGPDAEDAFHAAPAEDLVTAWGTATFAALGGDTAAARAATTLTTMIGEHHGTDPDRLLMAALAERAASNAEARREAEDQLQAREERRAATEPASAVAAGRGDRDRVVELNELAASYWAAQLPESPGAGYFAERLGAGYDGGPWAVGYAAPGWQNLSTHLRELGVPDEDMVSAGLAEPGRFGVRDVFRDRAMIAVRDHTTGEIVGFAGRDLSGHPGAPKVRNTGETAAFRKGDHVFGLYEAAEGARLVRAEGPFDAMAITLASTNGTAAGVSPMGTSMTTTQAAAIASRSGGRVWIANDNDAAGLAATAKDVHEFARRGVDARLAGLPGTDPAEGWRDQPEAFAAALDRLPDARSAAHAVLDQHLASPGSTPAGAASAMDEVGPHLSDAGFASLLDRVAGRDTAARTRPYDRRDEADHRLMSASAIAARDGSSHGFSAPAAEAIRRPHTGPPMDGRRGEYRRLAGPAQRPGGPSHEGRARRAPE